jgi:hypothetical protein
VLSREFVVGYDNDFAGRGRLDFGGARSAFRISGFASAARAVKRANQF